MRPGMPIVPILRQRSSESSTGRQRPSSAGRQAVLTGHRDLSARKEATSDGTATPPNGVALSWGARPVLGPVLKQSRRKAAGGIVRRTPSSARASHGGAGSTGGTGSSPTLSGAGAPSLNDFWNNIDGLDSDLQMRAEKMRSGRPSRPADPSMPYPRLTCTLDARTPDTPLDVVFPNTPESSFKDEASGSSPDALPPNSHGLAPHTGHSAVRPASARAAWTSSGSAVLPDDSPQPSSYASSQDSRHSPHSTSVRGGATGSSTAQRRGQTPPGRLQLRRNSRGDATVGQLNARIRELEGELETTFASMMRRDARPRQRRSGSAPPRTTRLARQSSPSLHNRGRQTTGATPHVAPQETPRILHRDTLPQSADASSFISEPSRLMHVCQVMQMERRQLLDTIKEVCEQCGVPVADAAGFDQSELRDPRTLLLQLRDQHVALRAQCAAGAKPNAGRLSIQSDLSDLSGFNGAPCESPGGQSGGGAAVGPFAAATAALHTLLEGFDEHTISQAPALQDATTRRDLATLIASAQHAEKVVAPVLAMDKAAESPRIGTAPRRHQESTAWSEGTPCSHDWSEAVKALRADIGPGVLVAVLGEARFSDEESECMVKAAAGELTAAMGPRIQFVTGSRHGAQECFARHCVDEARVWNLHPIGQESGYCIGRDISAGNNMEQCKEIFLQLADIYITIEGGPAVSEDARTVQARGAFVLPLRRTGWASSGMFGFPAEALQKPFFANEDHWEQLGSKAFPQGSSAAALIAVVAAFANEHYEAAPELTAADGCDDLTLECLHSPLTATRSRSPSQRAAEEDQLADGEGTPMVPMFSGSLALSPSTAPATPWSPDVVEAVVTAGDPQSSNNCSSAAGGHWPVEAPPVQQLLSEAAEQDGCIITEDGAGQALSSAGPTLWPTISPASSTCSMPAVGRLCELIEDKTREVLELQGRCDRASTGEEGIEAATLLAAAREELRLLREFAGVDGGAGESSPPVSDDGASVAMNFCELAATPEWRAASAEDVQSEEGLLQRAKHGLTHLMHLDHSQEVKQESSNEYQEEHKESLFYRAKHGLAHLMHLDRAEESRTSEAK